MSNEAIARASRDRHHRRLFTSTFGFMFFGVPNLGLRYKQLLAIVRGKANESLISSLLDEEGEPSSYLAELNDKFGTAYRSRKWIPSVYVFFETRHSKTAVVGLSIFCEKVCLLSISLAAVRRLGI